MTNLLATLTLGQTAAAKDPVRVFLVIGLLMAAVLALGLVIMALRKRLLSKDAGQAGAGSILEDIRAMRSRGEISDEEYQAMRQRVIRKMSPSSGAGLSAGGEGGEAPINSALLNKSRRIGRSGGGAPSAENTPPAARGDSSPGTGGVSEPRRKEGGLSPRDSGSSGAVEE